MVKKALVLLSAVVLCFPFELNAKMPVKTYGEYYVQNLPKQKLNKSEISDLLYMREEEKLARDVYLTLSKVYPLPVFRNISRSEEQHMKMVKVLLDKYGIPDPVAETGNRVGVFKNKKLQELYNKLVEQGRSSLIAALKVGATIEDLDIKDLEEAISKTDNEDVEVVYQNLMKGSRNHMRAFVRLLRRFGSDYTPQYISTEEFQRILSVKHEAGFYGSSGKPYVADFTEVVEGKVLKVEKVPGFGRRKVMWWTVDVKTGNGTVKVWLVPVWRYPSINLRPGDEVKVTGFVPPYWQISGIEGMMACLVENKSAGALIDFTFKPPCRGINVKGTAVAQKNKTLASSGNRRSWTLTGKVVSISQQPGVGRKNVTWWVADLETPQGNVKVYLAPTFRFPSIDVSPGDSLQLMVFTPPRWRVLNVQNTYMACYFKNLSKGSEYRIRRRCP
ncbi:DUF2202 domain-containing protein [Phorcysia thermohydrogeniphila]|uniref:DUF2202 domain-containing protein n=1 Tax=Phorcysia thermohydrogeniphila TaxID=936138 RepID=A0A4R1GDD0_9BACT|nr:DUF2202 domain-containing protein [Phorcysia thermohydrogeniphila]TCK06317.1 hypothetical protein CLV27_0118 [Phorcysia thermohydrogeniphila]